MLPTLFGRIQTRIFVTLVIGGLWAIVISPVIGLVSPPSIGEAYKAMYAILLITTLVGILWEFVYHGLMQFRWEKDWPTLFGLVTIVNEGIVVFVITRFGIAGWAHDVHWFAFLIGFTTTWVVIWLWVNGPMRIFTVHWRFRGGRLI